MPPRLSWGDEGWEKVEKSRPDELHWLEGAADELQDWLSGERRPFNKSLQNIEQFLVSAISERPL